MKKIIIRVLAMLCLAILSLGERAWAQAFNSQKDFDYAQRLLKMQPEGPAGKPWEQHPGRHEIDTSKYKKTGPYNICFSNAGVNNPWRVVGGDDMRAHVDMLKPDIK